MKTTNLWLCLKYILFHCKNVAAKVWIQIIILYEEELKYKLIHKLIALIKD